MIFITLKFTGLVLSLYKWRVHELDCLTKRLEDDIMTNVKHFNSAFPSAPSLFDRFFEREWMDWNRNNYSNTNTTLPAINVIENDNEFCMEVAAPGMKKEDFKLKYDNGSLTISSEVTKEHNRSENECMLRREFSYQSFQRTFKIADKVINSEKIEAKYEEGILRITLPKREEVKPKPAQSISIQ